METYSAIRIFAEGWTEILEFNKLLLEEIFEKYPDVLKKLYDFYQCRVQDTVEKVKTNLKK